MSVPLSFLEARRERALAEVGRGVCFAVHSGGSVPAPGRLDQKLGWQVHPTFFWLTGEDVKDSVIVFDPAEGWIEFFREATALDYVWDGIRPVGRGRPMSEFAAWAAGKTIVHTGAPGRPLTEAELEIETALIRSRRKKDAHELGIMRRACAATHAGFSRAKELIKPGMTEKELLVEINYAFQQAGSTRVGYDSILGAGPASIVFHGTPSDRPFEHGEQVLIDMGAEIDLYTADVTRTYAVGSFSPRHQAIYDVLYATFERCNAMCRHGVEWHDVHRCAAMGIADGLQQLGILTCDAETACESGAIALFFPHGIGHLVGLGVRDGTGQAKGRARGRKCCGIPVRSDFPLEEGFLTTVEPGVYFIPELLDPAETRATHAGEINFGEAEKWYGVGGFRLEDNLLVTSGEPENLTQTIPF